MRPLEHPTRTSKDWRARISEDNRFSVVPGHGFNDGCQYVTNGRLSYSRLSVGCGRNESMYFRETKKEPNRAT